MILTFIYFKLNASLRYQLPACLPISIHIIPQKKRNTFKDTQSQLIVKQTSYDFVTDHISQLLYFFFDKKAKNRICLVHHQ